jgi:hypothetical protein
MAKFKEIVENSPYWAKIRFIDIINMIDTSKTNKYTEMILKVLMNHHSSVRYDKHDLRHFRESIKELLNVDTDNMDAVSLIMIHQKLDMFNRQDIKMIKNFIDLNESKVLGGVDVSTIKTFQDMHSYTSLASLKSISKEFRKQVKIDYEDSEWLILRPFSFESSCKYGAGTKWCTTSESNPDHFFRYTKNGVLIYVINKKTGDKVGCFKSIDEPTSEFYNMQDIRVDSMDTNLPYEILDIIRELIKNEKQPNKLINEEVWQESYQRNNHMEVKLREYDDTTEPTPVNEEMYGEIPVMNEEVGYGIVYEEAVAEAIPSQTMRVLR